MFQTAAFLPSCLPFLLSHLYIFFRLRTRQGKYS